MKIKEIIEPIEKSINLTVPYSLNSIKAGNKSAARRGPGGVYGYGKVSASDPHVFNKSNRYPSFTEKDAYYQYIRAITPYMKSNPFFPRVYNITMKTDSEGRKIPRYQIESLQEYDNFSYESLVGIGESIFPGFSDATFKLQHSKYPEFAIWNAIAERISSYIAGYKPTLRGSVSNNKKFLEAVDIILDIQRKFDLSDDMHAGNIMIRGTAVGPQLVITDPVVDAGDSVRDNEETFKS